METHSLNLKMSDMGRSQEAGTVRKYQESGLEMETLGSRCQSREPG